MAQYDDEIRIIGLEGIETDINDDPELSTITLEAKADDGATIAIVFSNDVIAEVTAALNEAMSRFPGGKSLQ